MVSKLRPIETDEQDPPIIVTLKWHCGLAIGAPRWIGTDAYESPECSGEGEIAGPFDELEIDEDGDLEHVGWPVYCTSCGQEIEESDHFSGVELAVSRAVRVEQARERQELSRRYIRLHEEVHGRPPPWWEEQMLARSEATVLVSKIRELESVSENRAEKE